MSLVSHAQSHGGPYIAQPGPTPTETAETLGYSSSALWKSFGAVATHLIHHLTMAKRNVGLSAWKAEPKGNSRRNTREININFMVDSVLALTARAGEPGGRGRKEAILPLQTDFVNREIIKNFLELRRWQSW